MRKECVPFNVHENNSRNINNDMYPSTQWLCCSVPSPHSSVQADTPHFSTHHATLCRSTQLLIPSTHLAVLCRSTPSTCAPRHNASSHFCIEFIQSVMNVNPALQYSLRPLIFRPTAWNNMATEQLYLLLTNSSIVQDSHAENS